jgi:tetratricopeptide (TPR) repeat protein
MPNARKGKIARAPFEVRTQVNVMLRDGATAQQVIKFLESKDVFGVNDDNVRNWRAGGYVEWEQQQERLDDMRAKREFAMEIVKNNQGSQLHEATLHLAASQLYEAITDFDITRLKDLLDESPENYAAIVNSLAKLSKGALDLRKYQDAVASAQKEIQKLKDPKADLSDDDRKAIVDKVDEILGLK